MSLFITPIPKLSIIFFSLPSFGFERVGGDCYRTDLNKPLNKVFFYTNLI